MTTPGIVAGLTALLAGCTAACPAGLSRQQDVRLFFGGSVPAGEWAAFAAGVLTPAFPDGFTVYEATGQWRDPRGAAITREASRVVDVVGTPAASRLATVRAAYRARFAQQSVGLVIGTVCAGF